MTDRKPDINDQELIRLTLGGDVSAFGQLVSRYQDRLYNSMVQILRSESDAEDVVQDAFVLAFTKLDSFKGNSRLYTWLYRIAYNVAINMMRRRRNAVSLDTRADQSEFPLPDSGPSPEDRLDRQESIDQLRIAMNKLSVEHRSILVLREMDGLEYESISEILDLPIGTVRSRLHRARNQLKEHLEALMQQEKPR